MTLDTTLDARFNQLIDEIRPYGRVVVAFSGGVDSSLVALAAHKALGDDAAAVFCSTALISAQEHERARAIASSIGLNLTVLKLDVFHVPEVKFNHPDRCFHCKRSIFSQIGEAFEGYTVMDGTNFDDLFADRPGLKALAELGVISPLAQLKIGKTEVRSLAKAHGLANYNQPSAPCLATRFSSYDELTVENLARVERIEEILRDRGYTYVRARVREGRAVLEVHPDEVQKLTRDLNEVRASIAEYFSAVSVAPQGYQGSTL